MKDEYVYFEDGNLGYSDTLSLCLMAVVILWNQYRSVVMVSPFFLSSTCTTRNNAVIIILYVRSLTPLFID